MRKLKAGNSDLINITTSIKKNYSEAQGKKSLKVQEPSESNKFEKILKEISSGGVNTNEANNQDKSINTVNDLKEKLNDFVEPELLLDSLEDILNSFDNLSEDEKEDLANKLFYVFINVLNPEIIASPGSYEKKPEKSFERIMNMGSLQETMINKESKPEINKIIHILEDVLKEPAEIQNLLTKDQFKVINSIEREAFNVTKEDVESFGITELLSRLRKNLNNKDKTEGERFEKNTVESTEKGTVQELYFSEGSHKRNASEYKSSGESDFKEDSNQLSKEIKILEEIINSKDKTGKNGTFDKLLNRMNMEKGEITEIDLKEISSENAVKDVVKVIKYMQRADLKELTLKVNPKELGTITIKLVMEAGVMKANLSAVNKETYNLLNNNLSDMKSLLAQGNIKIQEVTVNIYNEDTTYFSGNFRDSSAQQNSEHNGNNAPGHNGRPKDTVIQEEIQLSSVEESNSVNMLV